MPKLSSVTVNLVLNSSSDIPKSKARLSVVARVKLFYGGIAKS